MSQTTMSFYKVTINMLSAIAMLNAISMLRTTVLHHNYAKCYMHAMCNSTLTILSVIAT